MNPSNAWSTLLAAFLVSASTTPTRKTPTTSSYRALGNQLFRADLLYQPGTVAPGQSLTHTTRLFAGAKESAVLDRYEAAGVPRFDVAIDWGWFGVIEKPKPRPASIADSVRKKHGSASAAAVAAE